MPEPIENSFLRDHFCEVLSTIENRISSEGQSLNYANIFHDIDRDTFFNILRRPLILSSELRRAVPDWPPEEIRMSSTSNIPFLQSMIESDLFWRAIRRHAGDTTEMHVGDYGAGWGRIARFAARDVGSLIAFEPNPVFQDLYIKCRLPGLLVKTDWESKQSLSSHGQLDLVYSFSILTHVSDSLARAIHERWTEITRPGSLVFATVRPRYFIEGVGGDADILPPDREELVKSYRRGELVYAPYKPESPNWGVTVMPIDYLARVFTSFKVINLITNPQTQNQLTVVLERI